MSFFFFFLLLRVCVCVYLSDAAAVRVRHRCCCPAALRAPHSLPQMHSYRTFAKGKCIDTLFEKRGKILLSLFHQATLMSSGNDREQGKRNWCDWCNQASAVTPSWSTVIEVMKAQICGFLKPFLFISFLSVMVVGSRSQSTLETNHGRANSW